MKKYQLQRIGESEIIGTFDSKADATDEMTQIIEENNEDFNSEDESYLTPFDFELKEIDALDVNEEITDYKVAHTYLGISVGSINVAKNHQKAMFALYQLIIIAEAWNKADGFIPDYSNVNQWKYYPWFRYDTKAAGFVCAATSNAATYAVASVGSRLCFSTSERALQFGEQFIDLWNDFLLFR